MATIKNISDQLSMMSPFLTHLKNSLFDRHIVYDVLYTFDVADNFCNKIFYRYFHT